MCRFSEAILQPDLNAPRIEERPSYAAERRGINIELSVRRSAVVIVSGIESRVIQSVDDIGPELERVVLADPRQLLNRRIHREYARIIEQPALQIAGCARARIVERLVRKWRSAFLGCAALVGPDVVGIDEEWPVFRHVETDDVL